jgi:Uma2 family endonuclease
MTIAQRLSEAEYEQFVWADPDHKWELVDRRLREKPGVTWDHGNIAFLIGFLLQRHLDRSTYRIAINDWRVRRAPGTIYIPDLVVVPTDYGQEFAGQPGRLAIFSQALPLVVEVWPQSTGDYDVEDKIPEYQRRGDLEIWRVHPYERTLTTWRRQPDGSYQDTVYHEGVAHPVVLPGVSIDLAELFADCYSAPYLRQPVRSSPPKKFEVGAFDG